MWGSTTGCSGDLEGVVDDFVVRRGDGAFAYNLAVVVDDADQGVEEVVRGSDLAESTPRQLWLARALGLPEPVYAHVPLVLGPDGLRLAKRHGAVTLRDVEPERALAWMAGSLGFSGAGPRSGWLRSIRLDCPALTPSSRGRERRPGRPGTASGRLFRLSLNN